MDKCPLSGLPCNHQKCIHVTEVDKKYTATKTFDMCAMCGPSFIETNEPNLKQEVDIVPAMPETHIDSAISDAKPINKLLDTLPPLVSDVLKMIINNKVSQPKIEAKSCSCCEHTLYDITKTGRLGCGTCYEYFRQEIKPIIEAYHKSSKHKGKCPKIVPFVEKPTLESLQKELKIAIETENYEEAAKIRDSINKLN
jgi:protein-arginine kinase activator protein McsA